MAQPLQGASSNDSNNSSQNHSKGHNKGKGKVSGHRHTLSLQKSEVTINVYDLLPVSLPSRAIFPSRFAANIFRQSSKISSLLWTFGAAFLHSGIVINNREYAYGGHNRPGLTGVYWTKPRSEPPGGTFKCSILQGFTLMSQSDIDLTIAQAAEEFQGTGYNLLSRNCNHFTNYLCEKLIGKPAPGWLNRAANIGVALPCIVPQDWVTPPDHDTAEGELMAEEGSDDESTESSRMLRTQQGRHSYEEGGQSARRVSPREQMRMENGQNGGGRGNGEGDRDAAGRRLPLAERAPLPDQ